MTVTLIVAFVVLMGGRIFLEWLAEKYESFREWLIVATIALVLIGIFMIMSFITQIIKQINEAKQALPQKSETPAVQRKKSTERRETRLERRAGKAAKAAWRSAHRDKIQRVEAYEKRWKRERGGG